MNRFLTSRSFALEKNYIKLGIILKLPQTQTLTPAFPVCIYNCELWRVFLSNCTYNLIELYLTVLLTFGC